MQTFESKSGRVVAWRLSGTNPPSTCDEGDFYVKTDNPLGQRLGTCIAGNVWEFPTGGAGTPGADGDSAYQVAVNNGFVGTEVQWLVSLEGPTGPQGVQGVPGNDGAQGPQGLQGIQGLPGNDGAQGLQGIQGIQGPAGADGLGVPVGGIIIILSGTCPAGFAEETLLNGKFALGTVAANADIGTTGGQDTVTQVINHVHAETAPTSASGGALRFAVDTNASGSVAAGLNTANPVGGVASIDNRPAFIKVIFCRKT